MDIAAITSSLCQRDDGIWVSRRQQDVSYPEDGNDVCFAVEDGSYWFSHRNQVIIHLVDRFSPSSDFFDIGGGNGCVSMALQSSGTETVLVEPGPRGVLNARQRGVRTVIQSTLEDAGFSRQSIPSAGLFDVVEHIEDDTGFLQLVRDYMQPRGALYVTVPAYQFLWSNDDVFAGHFRRYTTSSLSALLTRSGFRVAYCGYLFSFLVLPLAICRSIPSRLGFRKSVPQVTTEKEHGGGNGVARWTVQRLVDSEFRRIKRGKPIPFGTSCIAVAVKEEPAT